MSRALPNWITPEWLALARRYLEAVKSGNTMSDPERGEAVISLVRVTLVVCTECLRGACGQCHVPGCALWMVRAPDIPLVDKCESWVVLE